ncbi:DUF916 domain-containing protein [Patescibacteria group bacterium]|nr:DUF916 domain-containing protein [Patescibacteria group bacterium]
MIRTLFTALLFAFVLLPSLSFAQSDAGIGLKPANIAENMEPGEVRQFTVLVENVSGQDQNYYIFKRDISGVRDGGVPIFADNNLDTGGFALSDWIQLESDRLEVKAGEERAMSFIMSVPQDASPCDHFGGIFVSAEPPELEASGAAIGYQVANIVSIRVAGECIEKAQIRQFSTDNYFYGSSNVDFNLKFENSGNTLLRPTGPLTITNMFGKQVANLTFNEEQAGVFPGVTREFLFSWTSDQTGFGRYEAMVSPSYGEEGFKQTAFSTATFWILPMNIILPAAGVLAALLLIAYISIRVYVKRQLAYYGATSGTRKLVRRHTNNSSTPLLLILVVMVSVTALFLLILLALFA